MPLREGSLPGWAKTRPNLAAAWGAQVLGRLVPDPWNLPATPNQKFGDLVHQKLIERKRVLDYSMFIDPQPTEADIEDLIPLHLYSDAFNAAYVRELGGKTLNVTELDKHPRAVERINHWLRAKNISLLRDGSLDRKSVV